MYHNILLIDDDEDDQEIFLLALEDVSKKVMCNFISNASEALSKLLKKELKPDIIFLDLNMPVMNGQQFLAEIKKNQELKNIPVYIFSTSFHAPTIQLTKDLGAENFITKPGSIGELVSILKPIIN